jgi:LAS superfamily LD-carboxypeptidase LdcB
VSAQEYDAAMLETPVFSLEELTGRSRTHLSALSDSGVAFHKSVRVPFLAMCAAAAPSGIDLVAVSAFRDFDRQLAIWNAKFRGERPILDRDGRALDTVSMSEADRVEAILWWSALPGASRHHWGTDFDVMDRAVVPEGYKPGLVPQEYGPLGPFHRLTTWLDEHMHAFGFFRPYATDRGGVQPEPWHLSYAPLARHAARELTAQRLRNVLENSTIEGKREVLAALDRQFANYVVNVDAPPEAATLSPRLF